MSFLKMFFFTVIATHGLLSHADVFSIPVKPEEFLTPGSFCGLQDVDFKGFKSAEKIATCKRNLKAEIKELVYQNYRIPLDLRKCYSIDHLVPLSLGGNNAETNLWPEHQFVRAINNEIEQNVYKSVSVGALITSEAVAILLEQKKTLQVVIPADFECEPKK